MPIAPGMGIGLSLMFFLTACGLAESSSVDARETSVCGFVREPLAFWSFRRMAGSPDARRVASIRGIEQVSFQTLDRRRLGGYRLRAFGVPRGYLLVAQGNAMLADQIIGDFQMFRDRGLDVYVYDYRGYGLSGGNSRLNAIISDYRELIVHLNRQNYPIRALYGMSMGGVILLNAIGADGDFSALVVDASPSRISDLGCPERFDPVNRLPADCSRLQLIIGERDRVVWPGQMEELMLEVKRRGGKVIRRLDYAHPFQDDSAVHRRRLEEVADFLVR